MATNPLIFEKYLTLWDCPEPYICSLSTSIYAIEINPFHTCFIVPFFNLAMPSSKKATGW